MAKSKKKKEEEDFIPEDEDSSWENDLNNEKEDFKEWLRLWKLKTDTEKFEEAGKGLYGKDFDKVFNALQTSRGNPVKAYKLLKEMKEDELRH